MMQQTQTEVPQELVITRIFDAPRALVWKAWTEPERMKAWWGPRQYTAPVLKMDIRVGGRFLGAMESSDGKRAWSKGEYKEIVPQQRLVVTDSFSDENGNTVPPSSYGMSASWPEELLLTVTFEDHDGKTRMTLRHSGLTGIPEHDYQNMKQGWMESLDKLDEYLEKMK